MTHIDRTEKVLFVRIFLLILIFIFSFQSLSKAEDVMDFEIEGMSVGDSLLKYFDEKPIKIKLWFNKKLKSDHKLLSNSGFIHQIEYNSYESWKNTQAKYSFKRYRKSKYIDGLELRIDNSIETVRRFWEIHTDLSINKFKEIPQPFSFFYNIYIFIC